MIYFVYIVNYYWKKNITYQYYCKFVIEEVDNTIKL